MTDLLAMALVCNQTKVFNMVYSDSGSSLTRKGLDKSHHAFTHEEPVDPAKGYQLTSSDFVDAAMKEWAYFVEKLAATPEGDGSLLDRCLVYAHSDCQVAKVHSITGLPMMTAGKPERQGEDGPAHRRQARGGNAARLDHAASSWACPSAAGEPDR